MEHRHILWRFEVIYLGDMVLFSGWVYYFITQNTLNCILFVAYQSESVTYLKEQLTLPYLRYDNMNLI